MRPLMMILASVTCCLGTNLFAEDSFPSKMAVLELPEGTKENWKPIAKHISKRSSLIESIPKDQNTSNWTELLCIQQQSGFDTSHPEFIDMLIDGFKQTIADQYPGGKVSLKVVERGDEDFIYEKIIHEQYKDIPPEYEISHIFLENGSFYRVSYTKRREPISSVEKEGWLKRLRQSSSIAKHEEVEKMPDGFSLI